MSINKLLHPELLEPRNVSPVLLDIAVCRQDSPDRVLLYSDHRAHHQPDIELLVRLAQPLANPILQRLRF